MSKLARRNNPNSKEFWEDIYREHIDQNKIRSDGDSLLKLIPLFEKADTVLDFGGGMGGNLKYLSKKTQDTRYILVDHSEVSLEFVRTQLLGEKDERGNSFEYLTLLESIPDAEMVHIAPRSFSKKSGKPTTAYFYVEKPKISG